jgi:hypothetical protein
MIQDDPIKAIQLETITPSKDREGAVRLKFISQDEEALAHFRLSVPEARQVVEGIISCLEELQTSLELQSILRRLEPEGRA